ncbi:dicarboxylate/amino acid:cation symporter [Acholeplasma equirhinis]|uniref:dicarboxylate/amino acid:cation symporter n=1 Tax=Acholeplasma equirhinis TaxID=555393 RepID=UPI00197A9344|nr:dicarboxylate/amino acid:cation symporter [Acholeplasma equirhinis]MBN3490076.1 dicarboxylate/amino acid:cation symporter [Acholeplasma equirhinis]
MFDNYIIDSWQKGVLYITAIAVLSLIFLTGKLKWKFSFKVLLAMGLGLIVGFLFGGTKTIIDGKEASIIATIRPIGQLYTRLIQMIVVPLVLTAVIKSFTSLETTDKLKTIGLKTLFWLLATTTVAAAIGFFYASITGLGNAFEPIGEYTKTITPIEKAILDFFPTNVVSAMGGSVVMPVITFALFVSIAVIVENKRHKERTQPFIDFNNSLNTIMTRITRFVMKLTPYAVFSFMAYAVGRSDFDSIMQLGFYILIMYAAMLTHFVFIQMGSLAINGINPFKFIQKFSPAMFVAFTTQSSYGTLPVTMESLTKRVGVSDRVANFVGPLSANVGMNACGGIFPAVVAVLTANAYNIPFGPWEFILLLIVTTVSAIGIAGVPGIATIAAAVVLSSLGLPIEGIALIIAVDPLVDMGRTLINVIGGGVAATIVAKREKELDYEMLNSQDTQALNE